MRSKWEQLDTRYKKAIKIAILFVVMYCIGMATGKATDALGVSGVVSKNADNWGLKFFKDQEPPTGNQSAQELKKYDAYFIGDTSKKDIYLTFDAGFENGNMPAILDALKKHDVKATFFVVGHFLEQNHDLVNRMVAEGHTVANHTYHHRDMQYLSNKDTFLKEMQDVESLFESITGTKMTKYYRPPGGKYNVENLKIAQEMGYSTFFWSLAYVDWYEDKQPTKEEAFSKLLTRIHPGAVVLLHSTSSTNAQILDELLTKWEDMGYSVKPLAELIEAGK